MCRHRLGEGRTKGGRPTTRKKVRGWRERGGHVSSAEPTSCPGPKMERLQERLHSPSLTHKRTHTDTRTHTSQSCTLQRRWEENAASRKTYPPSGFWNTRKPWFTEEEDILSSGYKSVCVCVCVSGVGGFYWKWEYAEYTHLCGFNLKPRLHLSGVLISSPFWRRIVWTAVSVFT